MSDYNGGTSSNTDPIFGLGGIPIQILPPFAGGGIPSFVGGIPTVSIGSGENNQTTGNGNWYFNGENQTTGNGNWYFGSGNQTTGNGNWYLGNDNIITGHGNRPSGSSNDIIGNGNRPEGDDNVITGNRISVIDENQTILGNGDRYLLIDRYGNISVVNDPTAKAYDRTYNLNFPDDSGLLNNNLFATTMVTNSNTGNNTGNSDNSDLLELLRQSPFGRLFDIPGFEVDSPEDIFGNVGGGGMPPFGGGGTGGIDGNPWRNWNPLTDGNPFIEGDEPDISSSSTTVTGGGGSGNPFTGGGGSGNPFTGGGSGNPFTGGGGSGNPFAGGDPFGGKELVIFLGEGYLLKDEDGKWYKSEDNQFTDDDELLWDSSNFFSTIGGMFSDGDNPFASSQALTVSDNAITDNNDYPTEDDYVFDFNFEGNYPTADDYQYEYNFDDLTNGNSISTFSVVDDDLTNGDYPTASDYTYDFDFSKYPTSADYTYDFSNIGDFFSGDNPFTGGGSLPFPVGTETNQ